ncbi:MAG: hypothetical protein MJZ26_00930, partial [Fibrobacter sp.]|nr:hypothetical protein [Fibrobacter sp.]
MGITVHQTLGLGQNLFCIIIKIRHICLFWRFAALPSRFFALFLIFIAPSYAIVMPNAQNFEKTFFS